MRVDVPVPLPGNACPTRRRPSGGGSAGRGFRGFTFPDLLVVLAVVAVLAAVAVPMFLKSRGQARLSQCMVNLQQVNRAVLMYADEHRGILPLIRPSPPTGTWFWYKEKVKGYVGLRGPSSPQDRVFACPNDRGYDNQGPFCQSAKFDYTSYVFNGVNVPGVPNIAGRPVSSVKDPAKTLLTMEWTAHPPLSWHASRTGSENFPFYNDAENVVGFVDGAVRFIKIYYDGVNPAFTRDPIPGYQYKYSGD